MTKLNDQKMINGSRNMGAKVTIRPDAPMLLSVALTSSNRKHPYKNISHRLTAILFSICLICLSTGISRPDALETVITLNLGSPEYSSCGNVTIRSVEIAYCSNWTRFSWDWGDGVVADCWFPATHRYRKNGSYIVKVTAFCSTGATYSASMTVSITNAEDPLCNYSLLVYPTTLILRGGKTSETLLVKLRDADGAPVSLNGKNVSFFSTNSAIVQVDACGVVRGTGFGEAQITITVEGYPLTAKASVFAGEFRVEPPILLLATIGQPTGQLNLKVVNADGSPLNLTGRIVTFHGSNAVAQVNGSGLVTALRPPQNFNEIPYITAEIDGIWSHNASVIRVTSDLLNLNMLALQEPNIIFYIAKQIGSFNYQQIFTDFDVPRITNIAYQLGEEACGVLPFNGDVQYLVNDPGHGQDGTIPCGASGNPVRLGSDLDKAVNNSCLIVAFPPATPQWEVFFHEMGHNFTYASLSFGQFVNASDMKNSNFTFIEGLATAVSMYVGQMLSERATQYQIPANILSTIMSSVWHFGTTPDLDAYVNSGANYSTINPSVLDDIISVIANKYGYSILPRFFSVFLPPDASFGRFGLNNSDANQATFFVAAMSATAGTDLRVDFRDKWGFPVDDISFNQLYPELKRLITVSSTSRQVDFNGDGKEDILWRNYSTGQDVVWYLGGYTVSASGAAFADPAKDVTGSIMKGLAAVEMNQSYASSKVYRDAAEVGGFSGQPVGTMFFDPLSKHENWDITKGPDRSGANAGQVFSSPEIGPTTQTLNVLSFSYLPAVTDVNWTMAGTGDFNGDGKVDIVWRNTSTGQNLVWYMNGITNTGYAYLSAVTDQNWQIAGTGDFNGEGQIDILWRNYSTGQNTVWYMNGATYTGYVNLLWTTDVNWKIVGTGDFDLDGKVDILWRNSSTGQNIVWYMNGATYASYAYLSAVTDVNWKIVGTGDFNGDGKVDIIWRNSSTGLNLVWYMNGATNVSYDYLLTVADFAWRIANH